MSKRNIVPQKIKDEKELKSLIKLNPKKKEELQELVRKKKRTVVNIIKDWLDEPEEPQQPVKKEE